MDNRQFNVNGRGQEMLAHTLKLALANRDAYGKEVSMTKERKAAGYIFSKEKGLILLWHVDTDKNAQRFIAPLGPDALAAMIVDWLTSDQAKEVELTGWDTDADHDGHNELGWRVYCEDWGHVGTERTSIVAVKPAYLWYGK